MRCLVSNQGTATAETALCLKCYTFKNKCFARQQAAQTDDIDPNGDFEDCSENDCIACCICGAGIYDLQ